MRSGRASTSLRRTAAAGSDANRSRDFQFFPDFFQYFHLSTRKLHGILSPLLKKWEEFMKKKLILASAFVVVACAPALADDTYSLVKDTVGNFSAAVTSAHYPGMTIVS